MSDELTRSEIEQIVIGLLASFTRQRHIRSGCVIELETRLEATGLDSLDWAEFHVELDRSFEVHIDLKELDSEGKTVEYIVDAVCQAYRE